MGVKLPTMTSPRAHKSGSFMHWVWPFDCVVSGHDSVHLLALYQIAYVRDFFFSFQTHQFQELSSDDYFSKNNEFSTWLKDEKNVFFSDLSSESSRELFSDFIKVWNAQKLESRYYEGIASGPRTSHHWKIKG